MPEFPGEDRLVMNVIDLAEDVLKDYDTMQRIFRDAEDSEDPVKEEDDVIQKNVIEFQPLEDVFQVSRSSCALKGDAETKGMPIDTNEPNEDESGHFTMLPPRVKSPPPIHTFRPASKPRQSSTMIFTPNAKQKTPNNGSSSARTEDSPRSPSSALKPRSSGLPPPSGPDYTSPIGGHTIPKDKLKPFSNSKLQHRVSSNTPIKRSRLSSGFGAIDVEDFSQDKKRRRGANPSSE